ncbi:MAG: CHAT domain-containing protein, partial [Chitinophagales bacterium]
MNPTQIRQIAEKNFKYSIDAEERYEYQKSIDFGEKAITLFQQLGDDEKVIEVKLNNFRNYVGLGRNEEASAIIKVLEQECEEKLGAHELTIIMMQRLTYFYISVLKKMDEGIACARKCLKIHLNMERKDASLLTVSYNNLGFAYGSIGDHDQQLLYYQKAGSNALEAGGEEHGDVGNNFNNLGYYYQNIKEDYPKAMDYHQKALHINKKNFGDQSYQVALGYFNMGYVSHQTQDFTRAIEYYKKTLSILEDGVGRTYIYADVKLALGKTYAKMGLHTAAIEEYTIALQISNTIIVGKSPGKASTLNNWSTSLREMGEYELALEKNHSALLQILKVEDTRIDFFHTPLQLEDFKKKYSLLPIFIEKAHICLAYFNEKPTSQKYLKLCLDTCLLANRYVKEQRTDYHTSGTKMTLNKSAMALYELGIEAGIKTADQTKGRQLAFDFSEQAKANLLFTSIHESIVKQNADLPAALLQQEKSLKLELTRLDKSIQLQESLGAKKDTSYIKKLQNQFFDSHKVYLQLIEKIEQSYPDYYQLKYQTETTSIETIQSTLSDNQWMVSYFVGETHYYIFFIGKGVFEVLEYEKTDSFEALVDDFLQSIQQHQLDVYTEKAYELYQYLLQPIEMYLIDPLADFTSMEEHQEMAQMPQLIIIPHGILNYVPFEALICTRTGKRYDTSITGQEKNKAYQSLDNLLLHCEVSYHYSATLWHYLLTTKGEKAPPSHDFVGFAPVYENTLVANEREGNGSGKSEEREENQNLQLAAKEVSQWATRSEALRSDGTWTPLPHSKTEAQNIAALFEERGLSTQTFLHEQATKEQFQQSVENSRFLLIATHGVVNDERPKLSGLVFYPNRKREVGSQKQDAIIDTSTPTSRISLPTSQTDCILSMEETYHLNLSKTDLVVLSSCESGIGELAKGEGMMAVNRGFLYAGAK